ncbi:hypothetical protein B4U80_00971, partial [Leptotrombidium deliense]
MLRRSEDFGYSLYNMRLDKIYSLEMSINKYQPLKGGSYIKLPKWIIDKKAIINIRNSVEKCFIWSILAALHPVENNPQRGINFPINIKKDVPKFEKLNAMSINILSCDNNETITPLY